MIILDDARALRIMFSDDFSDEIYYSDVLVFSEKKHLLTFLVELIMNGLISEAPQIDGSKMVLDILVENKPNWDISEDAFITKEGELVLMTLFGMNKEVERRVA